MPGDPAAYYAGCLNQYRLEALDLRTATEAERRAAFNRMRAEDLPKDPPVPFEGHLARWRNRPEDQIAFNRLVRGPQGQAVGLAEADYDEVPQNRHLAGRVGRQAPNCLFSTDILGFGLAVSTNPWWCATL